MGVPYADVCEREPCIKIWLHRGKDRQNCERLCTNNGLCGSAHTSQPFWLESQQGLPDQSQVDGFLMDGPYKKKMTFLS